MNVPCLNRFEGINLPKCTFQQLILDCPLRVRFTSMSSDILCQANTQADHWPLGLRGRRKLEPSNQQLVTRGETMRYEWRLMPGGNTYAIGLYFMQRRCKQERLISQQLDLASPLPTSGTGRIHTFDEYPRVFRVAGSKTTNEEHCCPEHAVSKMKAPLDRFLESRAVEEGHVQVYFGEI